MLRDRQGLGWLFKVIALLIIGGLYAGVAAAVLLPRLPAPYAPPIAESGDVVEVDYRGWFPDNWRTFDTSIVAVANDNATFQKAASFQYRTGSGQYQPLTFTLGCRGGSGCTIVGFQNAVRGRHLGESFSVTLPPKDAYGLGDPNKILVRTLLEEVVVTETMNATTFQQRYGTQAIDGSVVTDTAWGWNVTVHVSGNLVTIRNSPVVGAVITVAGKWRARVVTVDDSADEGRGIIRVQHLLKSADVRRFVASDRSGNFLIDAVDAVARTFTVNYNPEVVGKTLAFDITVRTIHKAKR